MSRSKRKRESDDELEIIESSADEQSNKRSNKSKSTTKSKSSQSSKQSEEQIIDQSLVQESKRITTLAYQKNLLQKHLTSSQQSMLQSSNQSNSLNYQSTNPPVKLHKALTQRPHADIAIKSQSRASTRFACVLPGNFSLVPAKPVKRSSNQSEKQSDKPADKSDTSSHDQSSFVGSFAQLDTPNPVMYIDCPSTTQSSSSSPNHICRIKLLGTIVYPSNIQLLAIQFPSKTTKKDKPVQCKAAFDHLLVFSEYYWIGSRNENPEEKPMKMPEELTIVPIGVDLSKIDEIPSEDEEPELDDEKPAKARRTSKPSIKPSAKPAAQPVKKPTTPKRKSRSLDDSDETGSDQSDDDELIIEPIKESASRPRRSSARAVSYIVDEESGSDDEQSNDQSDQPNDQSDQLIEQSDDEVEEVDEFDRLLEEDDEEQSNYRPDDQDEIVISDDEEESDYGGDSS